MNALPTQDGAYVIVFTIDNIVSTHSVDRFEGIWWDGSKIVSEGFIAKMTENGVMYRASLIPLP